MPEEGGGWSVRASMIGILLKEGMTPVVDQKQAPNCHQSIEITYR
jgi:hypothetical protein